MTSPWTVFGSNIIRHFETFLTACVLLASASCSPAAEQANGPVRDTREVARTGPQPAKLQRPVLMLDGRGLVIADAQGTKHTIAFEGPASEAVAAARDMFGEPNKVERLEECGAGPLQISRFAGLTLAAQDGKFAGWWLDDSFKRPLPTTAAGIGIGSTRSELQESYTVEAFESTIGHEFTADGIGGLTDSLGKLGKITNLWAGATCIMR